MYLWRFGTRAYPFTQRAALTSSSGLQKAGRTVPSANAIARKKSTIKLLTPQYASRARARSEDQQRERGKPDPGLIRKYGGRNLYIWAALGTLWYVYVAAKYTQHREFAPITGRRRYKGLFWFNKAFDRGIEEAVRLLNSETEAVYLPHDLDAALLLERVRTVLERVALAAGLEDAPLKIRYVGAKGPPKLTIAATGELFINKAMMQAVLSDSQLAFVLAHELGHHLAGHVKEGASVDHCLSCLTLPLWPIIIPGGAVLGLAGIFKDALFFLPHALMLALPATLLASPAIAAVIYSRYSSRQHEFEADLIGVCPTAAAGYDHDSAPKVMKTLGNFEEQLKTALRRQHPNTTVGSRHETDPPIGDRIDRFKSLISVIRATVSQQDGCLIQADRSDINHVP